MLNLQRERAFFFVRSVRYGSISRFVLIYLFVWHWSDWSIADHQSCLLVSLDTWLILCLNQLGVNCSWFHSYPRPALFRLSCTKVIHLDVCVPWSWATLSILYNILDILHCLPFPVCAQKFNTLCVT